MDIVTWQPITRVLGPNEWVYWTNELQKYHTTKCNTHFRIFFYSQLVILGRWLLTWLIWFLPRLTLSIAVCQLTLSESESHCDWRSVSLSVLMSSPVRGSWPDISYCLTVTVLSLGGGPLWREGGFVFCQSLSAVVSQLSVRKLYTLYMFYMKLHSYTTYTRPPSVRAQYSRLCPTSGSLRYNGSPATRTVVCLTAAKFTPLVFSVTGLALSNDANTFIIMTLYDLRLLPT
jgi:hypothetical protein